MDNLLKIYFLVAGLFIQFIALCQNEADNAEPKSFMRSDGKIYVVVAIVVTILAGLIIYVARLDRKITKLEKEK